MNNPMASGPQRVHRELMDLHNNPSEGFTIKLKEGSSWSNLVAFISGPPNTPYEGGTFEVQIALTNDYPADPPEVDFVTKIWHPNIKFHSELGRVCVDFLKSCWDPKAMTIKFILIGLEELLANPNPFDPLDIIVGVQLKNTPKIFDETARHWTALYAGGPTKSEEYDKLTKVMCDMGVETNDAVSVLSVTSWKLAEAADLYFS